MPELEVVRRNGDRHVVLFDEADAELIGKYTWGVQPSEGSNRLFYARTWMKWPGGVHVMVLMHILLMGRAGVDHVNHNGLDNRRSNLRTGAQWQNRGNARKPQLNRLGTETASQYKGVSRQKGRNRWRATIRSNSASMNLGSFVDEIEAARAYDRAAVEVFGTFACLNFPEERT